MFPNNDSALYGEEHGIGCCIFNEALPAEEVLCEYDLLSCTRAQMRCLEPQGCITEHVRS
ncbi:hypothetical protein LINGRAHAP2_LOCUS23029 [Linum grandiflorum]